MKTFSKIFCAVAAAIALVDGMDKMDGAPFTYSVTNNTLQGVDIALYASNSPGFYTFQTFQFIGASAVLVLTNSAPLATNGIAVLYTNQNSFSGIATLTKLPPLIALNANGCYLTADLTNDFTRFTIGDLNGLAPQIGGGSESGSTNPPEVYNPISVSTFALNAGIFSNAVATVAVPNTNELFVAGAGTTAANSEYVLQGSAFAGNGWVYTNILTTANVPNGYVCANLTGVGTYLGNDDSMPFYMGPTTNDMSTVTTNNGYWYVSVMSPIAYWTNSNNYLNNNAGPGGGANPSPTVTYGTNLVAMTNTVWLCPSYFTAEFTNGIIHVSATLGNDTLAQNLQCAFATCRAAKNFAKAGDTIDVSPGTYWDHDLLKNGVDWNFEKNTTLAWDDPQTDMSPRGLFDDYAGAVTSTITGDRIHFTDASPCVGPAMLFTNPATWIVAKFNRGDYANYSVGYASGTLPGAPASPPVGGFISQLVYDQDGGYVDVSFNRVDGYTNAPRQFIWGSGNSFGEPITVTNTDGGFTWSGGEEHAFVHSLVDTNNGGGYAFESANRFTNETSCFFTADYVNGFTYWQDSNTNARTWLNIGFLDGAHSILGNGAAARYEGQAVNYYTGMKMAGTGADILDMGAAGDTGQRLWLTLQKMTQNGAGSFINFAPSSKTFSWINCQYYEDNSGLMTSGMNVAGGTNFFSGGQMLLQSTYQFGTPGIAITGGGTSLTGMTIQTAGTNYPIAFFGTAATNGGLTLNSTLLIPQTAMASIWSSNNVWITGSFIGSAPTNLVHIMNSTNYYHAQTAL